MISVTIRNARMLKMTKTKQAVSDNFGERFIKSLNLRDEARSVLAGRKV